MIQLEDKGRYMKYGRAVPREKGGIHYRRLRHSESEKIQLANNGLQWVNSSNVSAIGVNDNDLIIRFHNGSLYKYPNQGALYDDMLKSNSKGHFVWAKLRWKNVAYMKIGALPFKDDKQVTDDDIFNLIDLDGLAVFERLKAMGLFIPTLPNGLDLFGL
jgi:hypothetical protein